MNNLFKKTSIALAVAAVTLSTISTASAESLLAPVVINDANYDTFVSMRTGGVVTNDELHYHWIKKGKNLNSLKKLGVECSVVNSTGTATPKDMIYQDTQGNGAFVALPAAGVTDASVGSGYLGGFAGMMVVDVNGSGGIEEGNFVGFAYIVNSNSGVVLDYKMVNNHKTSKSGDFSTGYAAKKSIDYSWLPETVATTQWITSVLSNDMTAGPEQAGVYDATVLMSNQPREELDGTANQQSPQILHGGIGVMDNDENPLSGGQQPKITCMGMYDRLAFIDPAHENFTKDGGWTRRAIQPVDKVIDAQGALTFKWEKGAAGGAGFLGGPTAQAFQVETGGNLSVNGTKANKPL